MKSRHSRKRWLVMTAAWLLLDVFALHSGTPLRIGMINCDLHAFYYAALFETYDPILLRDDPVGRGHAAYYYMYMHYDDPRRMTAPRVNGLTITRVWDREPAKAENLARIFGGRPQVCRTVAEVSDNVDLVFIADCNGDGADHLRLATPGIEKHVPTFIDKPLAADFGDARKLVDLSRKCRTPLMSLSMLRELPQAARFASRFDELGAPEFAVIKGGGETLAGQIHAISLAQHLFGPGVEAVSCMGSVPLAHILLDYGNKAGKPAAGVMLSCASGGTYHASMYASVYSRLGVIHSPPFGDFEFPWGAARILEMAREMVRTGRSPVSDSDMLECIAVAAAARLARQSGRKVYLSEVWSPDSTVAPAETPEVNRSTRK